MIIFGTRGVTLKTGSGEFHCPQCQATRPYTYRTMRRFFTLYFIPLIPLDKLGEYVECGQCKGTFRPEILHHDPEAERNQAREEFADHIKRVGILTAIVDGDIEDEEAEAILDIYDKLGGRPLTPPDLRTEMNQARAAQASASGYVQRFSGMLNEHGKELVIKAALRVALADGPLNVQEEQLMDDLAASLNMTQAHFRGIMAEMEDSSAP
ncbi:MAG: TerB family tellurite resistance protein [Isosphaeraceae bacterium]